MTFIKYILKCILDFFEIFDPPTIAFWKEIIIGFIIIAVIAATFILSFIFLNWWLALIITLGGIFAFCLLSIIIELIVKEIIDIKSKNKKDI